ncbi:hypothetical protein Q5P01_019584 [Channa striata]|uniref:LRRN4 C-terminal-like protein n=1 Tax=Channa striata TaxID=64152 RepID=A0AA88S581_CHASR|nr:hypothetical protein Q5P01_019584 [Channa striata]
MAASRALSFPLAIVCLVLFFIRGYSPLPTRLQVMGTNPMSPQELSHADELHKVDYSDYEDTTIPILPTKVSPNEGITQKCNYNPCMEISCAKLAALSGCLCPGLTLNNEPPAAPTLKSVSWNGSEVTVQWCAPYSYVTAYNVTIGGKKWLTFGRDQRSGAVGNIDNITQVCVIALNDSGNSSGSCMMYQPRDNSLALKGGLIGGALLSLLLLLLVGVLVWRHKKQKKQGGSIPMHDTAGTQ